MKIILTSKTTIPSGVAIRLTPAQLESRRQVVEQYANKKGVFVGKVALEFKAGEEIEIIGGLPKGILPVYDEAFALAALTNENEAKTDK
jgi:hypothetical protein